MTLHSRTLDLARLGTLFSLFAVVGCGHGFAAGVGAGRARFGIGGEHTARTSPLLSARAFVPEADRGGGLLALDLQLAPLHNPLRDETVTVLYVVPQLQIGGSALCLRAGLGPSIESWGGNDPAGGIELVPSLGASVAAEPLRVRGHRVSVEALYRAAAGMGEDAVTTTLLGAQVSLSLGGPRREAVRTH